MSTVVRILKLVGAFFVLLLCDLASGGCIEKERKALIEVKASLVLDDTSLLSTWDDKSDCCAWEGIVCNNHTGHVEKLVLNVPPFSFAPFRGEINTSLMELQDLKHLDLSWSIFSSHNFPEMFGSLSNLRILVLQASFFGGGIPTDLVRLSHLQYLDLSSNGLEGTIPHQLGKLPHLQHLDLSNNRLVGIIPHELGYLSHLQYLNLSSNILFGTIPHHLGSLSNLQKLHLGDNQGLAVYDKNIHVEGGWLSNLTLLTHLDLSDVQNLNSPHAWLQMTGKFPKIEELKLSYCDLSALSLPDSVSNFSKSLRILDIAGNNFWSSKIFEWVFNATSNLIELDLSYNIFKGPIAYDFGNVRNQNPLEQLDLSHNELLGGTLEPFRNMCTLHSLHLESTNLSKDISTLLKLFGCARHSLQDLSLKGNQITGTFPDLSIFPSLIAIDLSNNFLSGKVPDIFFPSKLESLTSGFNSFEGGIPESFGNLCSLRSLDMSNNNLSEDISLILSKLSVGCTKYSLQVLDLTRNQIIGTLPDISGFSSLVQLYLSHNLLNGKIQKKSAFPHKLKSLYLDFNNLEGVITESHFSNMSMLKYLHLTRSSLALKFSENWVPPFQLSTILLGSCVLGPSFPKWLQSQKYLENLDISDAAISDVVPVWFWAQSTNVVSMNISYNNLTGTIPNLPIRFTEYFQGVMDSNQFVGSIPQFFRTATLLKLSKNKFSETHLFLCTNTTVDRLHILDLSMNQLSKKLPDCWSHFEALEFLDLSDNTLSGEVPSSMGSLLELKALILRNNSLSGKLPFSFKSCTKLFMLDLGYNRFSGPIPYWFGQELKMLSLRRNQFYGSLPQSLCYLTNIQLLDLSENNLSGNIFKCLKNFSAMSQNVSSNSDIVPNFLNYTIVYEVPLAYEVYDLTALLMWKGVQRLFKNNKLILRSIDLSSNQLIGEIPKEIGNLIELVSLNLSHNNLTGEITSKIGSLRLLEFLDLSRNHLSGLIPPSLTQIDRLSMLNLSDNQLSGSIPIGTQLQSFDASSYEGNDDLCGKPLDKKCPEDEEIAHKEPKTLEENNPQDKAPIYWSAALGFITGFWGLFGSLLLSRTWRHVYVLFLINIIDTVWVFTVLNATKLQKCLRGLQEKFV